jgi:OmpA-OmpF porin, OOP family
VTRTKAADTDGDGYPDAEDTCPTQPENYNGVSDQDGCPDDPDIDGDGLAASVDSCPTDPEDADGYLDSDGCPEADNDLDGILDAVDHCPLEPEDPDGYEDADGCPDLDNDHDEVPDIEDQCPNEVGPADREPRGCPKKPALAVVTDCEVRITEQIHFEYNRAQIRAESRPILDAVADVLRRNPSIKLEVQGHTDDRGSANYNLDLSQRRAAAVVTYLLSQGVAATRIAPRGYGMERPLVENSDERTRALNRRVQFVRTEGQRDNCQAVAP